MHRSAGAPQVLARLGGDEDVVQRRLHEIERLAREPGLVQATTDRADFGRVPCSSSTIVRHAPGNGRPQPRRHLRPATPCPPDPWGGRGWGLPTSAFSAVGVPSATQAAAGDGLRGSAKPVGLLQQCHEEDSGPLRVELADLLPRCPAADGGRARRRARPGQEIRGRWMSAEAAAHPPEKPTLRSAASVRPTRSRSHWPRSMPSFLEIPWRVAAAAPAGHQRIECAS